MNLWIQIRDVHELVNMKWEIMNSMNMKFETSWKVHMNPYELYEPEIFGSVLNFTHYNKLLNYLIL